LGRRNVTDEQKTALIGEAYKARKMSVGGDRKSDNFSSAQSEHLKHRQRTVDRVAKDFSVGKETVKRAEYFLTVSTLPKKYPPALKPPSSPVK